MKIFKLKRRFIKKFLRACITLFMCVSIVCCSVVAPVVSTPVRVEASAEVIAKIGAYILSALGVVNMTTNGGITSASNSIRDSINQKVSDYLGSGVYEDSNGNYVFSNEFTNEIYNILSSTYGTSARVISNFGSSDGTGINSAYITSQCLSNANSHFQDSDTVVKVFYQGADRYGSVSTYIVSFRINEIAFIIPRNDGRLYCYDKNLNKKTVSYYVDSCYVSGSYSNTSDSSSAESTDVGCYLDGSGFYNISNSLGVTWWFQHYPHLSVTATGNNMNVQKNAPPFNSFSVYNGNKCYISMRCNRSLVIADSTAGGNAITNQSEGIFYNTSDFSIPSVSTSVIENNNWSSIYNNYVTNVSNNYNTSSDKSIEKLRQIMKNYGDNIIDAIEQGSSNIEEQLNYTNEWLNRIYIKLDNISAILQELNSKEFTVVVSGGGASTGGGSCNWTQNDIDTLLSDIDNIYSKLLYSETYLYHIDNVVSGSATTLDNIYNNNVSQLSYLENLYTLLSNVYTAILNIDSGGGGSGGNIVPVPDSDPYDDWFDVLHNIDELDLDNVISKWDVVKSLIQDSLPFVMLTLISVTLTNFVALPQDPIFTIPVKLKNNFVDIDETITIDLTLFESILPMVRSMILIFWAVCLILFWLWLLPKLIYIY